MSRVARLCSLLVMGAVLSAAGAPLAHGAERSAPARPGAAHAIGAGANGGLTPRAQALLRHAARTTRQRKARRTIVGGSVIGIRSAPWQVNVWGSEFECGGSILSSTTILTASHCVDESEPNQPVAQGGVVVWAGVSRNDTTSVPGDLLQERAVTTIRIHPLWDGRVTATGDVSVLSVWPPLTLDGVTTKAVQLPPTGAPPVADALVGTTVRVTGYGVMTANTATADGALRALDSTLADPDFCGVADNAVNLCGRAPTGSSCQGDSGGPIVIPPASPGAAPVQIGTVSNGPVGCNPDTSDRWTNLYAPEVRAFIDGSSAPPIAPRLGGRDPALGGAPNMRVGETVTCAPASFVAATAVETKLTTDDGAVLAAAATGSVSFVLGSAQLGKIVRCRSYGTSVGGTAVSRRVASTRAVAAVPVVAPPVVTVPPQVVVPPVVAAPPLATVATCEPGSPDGSFTYPKRVRRGQTLRVSARLRDRQTAATNVLLTLSVGNPRRTVAVGARELTAADIDARATAKIRIPRTAKLGMLKLSALIETRVQTGNSVSACESKRRGLSIRVVR